ncbi:peroxiredoxin-like family protein [Flaviramulus aquimarinus]|uniref:thioredoxin-dependent peroxiredoxin n=1 Tax=Flaviramulus aquimarinus TaxID=1170456 RepID=A0ABP9EVY0_9FLAO
MGKLNKADSAPDFTSEDYLGKVINLKDYQNDKILLSFFRGATCPFCNLRLNQLIKKYPEFKRLGIKVITIFASSKEEISTYSGQQKAPFTIIVDPTKEIYKNYGIEESYFGMFRTMINPLKMLKVMFSSYFNMKSIKDRPILPADFLIDQDNKIYVAYYGKNFGDHMPIQDILEWKK